MNRYLVTLIHGTERTVRQVMAQTSMQATLIGIRMLPDVDVPVSVFCKPLGRTS